MAVRTINYTVSADGISPSTQQQGGVQGEHNATELVFYLDNRLLAAVHAAATELGSESVVYRFDGHTGTGSKSSTSPQPLPEDPAVTLKYPLENWLTRDGGNIQVYLIITAVKDDETQFDIYSFPANIRLKNTPDSTDTEGENYESISTLSEVARKSAETAIEAKDAALAAQNKTEQAKAILDTGAEWIFDGGTASDEFDELDVYLVVDAELDTESKRPVQNKAVALGLKTLSDSLASKAEQSDLDLLADNVDEMASQTEADLKTVGDELTAKAEQADLDNLSAAVDLKASQDDLDTISQELTAYKSTVKDLIVASGTSGSWYYEKMNSGIVKLWAKTSISYDNTSVLSNQWFALPFTLTKALACVASLNSNGGNSASALSWNVKCSVNDALNTLNIVVHDPSGSFTSSSTVEVSVEVIGKWK